MSDIRTVSDEQLNAFVDGQLDSDERAQVLAAIQSNKEVEEKYNYLCQMKEMVSLAYDKVPEPAEPESNKQQPFMAKWKYAVAATLILTAGISVGWFAGLKKSADRSDSFLMVNQLDAKSVVNKKVLLHISTMDRQRVDEALNKAETLLAEHQKKNQPLDLEIIANAQGLGLLRDGSPYANKIKSMTDEYSNVSFLACGIARETARLREGHDIKLLPQASQVPAALDQILKRIKLGWLYVRA